MPVTRSYSLPDEVAQMIDALPKRERSKFVATTLQRAVQNQLKQKALDALNAITPLQDSDNRPSHELLDESRQQRSRCLLDKTSEYD